MTTTLDKEAEETVETPSAKSDKPKTIGVPREVRPNEHRVAATPDTAKKLQKLGFDVLIETGAGAEVAVQDRHRVHAEPLIEHPRVHGSEIGFVTHVAGVVFQGGIARPQRCGR